MRKDKPPHCNSGSFIKKFPISRNWIVIKWFLTHQEYCTIHGISNTWISITWYGRAFPVNVSNWDPLFNVVVVEFHSNLAWLSVFSRFWSPWHIFPDGSCLLFSLLPQRFLYHHDHVAPKAERVVPNSDMINIVEERVNLRNKNTSILR